MRSESSILYRRCRLDDDSIRPKSKRAHSCICSSYHVELADESSVRLQYHLNSAMWNRRQSPRRQKCHKPASRSSFWCFINSRWSCLDRFSQRASSSVRRVTLSWSSRVERFESVRRACVAHVDGSTFDEEVSVGNELALSSNYPQTEKKRCNQSINQSCAAITSVRRGKSGASR